MTDETRLDNFHVVLVEPAHSLNVGATARAMMNLGFHHLHLVAPIHYDPEQARITARSAEPLLQTMRVHPTFEACIGEMEEVVGLALLPGKNPSYFATLSEWAGTLLERADRKTALVFGPEDNGLRQEHLNHCRWVVRIPSTSAFDCFNLAQSVLLTLYEVANHLPDTPLTVPTRPMRWALRKDYVLLDSLVESVMQKSGFTMRGPQPPSSGAVRNLFGRLELTTQEIGILLSLFGRVEAALHRKSGNRSPE